MVLDFFQCHSSEQKFEKPNTHSLNQKVTFSRVFQGAENLDAKAIFEVLTKVHRIDQSGLDLLSIYSKKEESMMEWHPTCTNQGNIASVRFPDIFALLANMPKILPETVEMHSTNNTFSFYWTQHTVSVKMRT